jgi:hypothetical protein
MTKSLKDSDKERIDQSSKRDPLTVFVGMSSPKNLYPIIKIDEPNTHAPWLDVECQGVVIKAQHLLSKNGKRTNKIFDQIEKFGGIHPFLTYEGPVIISSIMPDKTLLGFSPEFYAEMINALRPDSYITSDGETYLGEHARSSREIRRMIIESEKLIRLCPDSHPIGLVKGCTLQQISAHTDSLLNLGISQFTFHASDYLRRGPAWVTDRAIQFSQIIRHRVPSFLIYGVGAMTSLQAFNFADGFITQSHFVNAYYGRKICDDEGNLSNKVTTRKEIMDILRRIKNDIGRIKDTRGIQKELCEYCNLFGIDYMNKTAGLLVTSCETSDQKWVI